MSKSYNNTLPLFGEEKKLRKAVMKMVTNSQSVEEVKNPDECAIFELFKNFSSVEAQTELRKRYLAGGMGWGEAKQALFEAIRDSLQPMKEKYEILINEPSKIDAALEHGETLAREIANKHLNKIKKAVGIL